MPVDLRVILNTFYSGPQAWFFVAEDRGLFASHGLNVTFTEGDTLANAVPKVASGAFDLGYGDINALIELEGRAPGTAPIAVYAMHNRSPYTIAVAADGPIRRPADLEGLVLLSHPNDAALRMFPEFCRRTNIVSSRIQIAIDAAHHRDLVARVLAGGGPAGLFGFVNTLNSAAREAGIEPGRLRHFEWRHHVPELYGAAIIASRRLVATAPAAVAAFVASVNAAVRYVVADPDAAIDAVARRNPKIDRTANRERLLGTLAIEMAHPETARLGLGAIDPDRLQRSIDLIATVKNLPFRPSSNVFDDAFLPPDAERVHILAQSV